jgi:RimJ/RimL family protein N-acetyltransferase
MPRPEPFRGKTFDRGSLPHQIQTERLWLRRWRNSDLVPFAALNADPVVMEFFPSTLSTEESDAQAMRIQQGFDEQGFGLWAVEVRDTGEFAGFIGLGRPRFEAAFTPCVEVGWRLAQQHWRKGYATEGANAALDSAFRYLNLDEVVTLTAIINERSWRVMERIGMTRSSDEDFDHPNVPAGHELSRHVLYRIQRGEHKQTAE